MRTLLRVGGVLVVGLTLPWSGCSLIGLAVDASERPDTLSVGPDTGSLEGRIVAVTLRDGYSVAGECRRVGRLTGPVYRARYARWREVSGDKSVPFSPDDTISIMRSDGTIMSGMFEGFTHSSVLILSLRGGSILFPSPMPLVSIAAREIDSIRGTSGPWLQGRFLESLLEKGSVPAMEAILLKRGGESTWVPLDEIARIREIRYSYSWFNTGAIADAVGLAGAVVLLVMRNN